MTKSAEGQADVMLNREQATGSRAGRERLVAAGGVLGAIAASSCCIVPLLLFSIGAGGVWIGTLTALSPYQPIFVAVTAGFLGYGYYLVYRKPKAAYDDNAACARPVSGRMVKGALWVATGLVVAALGFPWYAPLLLNT